VFRFAVASGVADVDPTYALRDALIRPTRVHRAAITEPKARGRLMAEIDGFDGKATTRIALKLLAMLAQRPGEIRNAKWVVFSWTKIMHLEASERISIITQMMARKFGSLLDWRRPELEHEFSSNDLYIVDKFVAFLKGTIE